VTIDHESLPENLNGVGCEPGLCRGLAGLAGAAWGWHQPGERASHASDRLRGHCVEGRCSRRRSFLPDYLEGPDLPDDCQAGTRSGNRSWASITVPGNLGPGSGERSCDSTWKNLGKPKSVCIALMIRKGWLSVLHDTADGQGGHCCRDGHQSAWCCHGLLSRRVGSGGFTARRDDGLPEDPPAGRD